MLSDQSTSPNQDYYLKVILTSRTFKHFHQVQNTNHGNKELHEDFQIGFCDGSEGQY